MKHYIAINAGVETWRIRKSIFREDHWQKMTDAAEKVSQHDFIILDDVSTLPKMRENILKYQPDIVVIDNFQNMDFPKSDNFWTFHMGIVAVKRMAMTHNVAMIGLSQVTRSPAEIRGYKPPTLENLFGSRAIKQNADCIAMVYWPWKDSQTNGDTKQNREKSEYWVYHMKMREEGLAQTTMDIDPEHGVVKDRKRVRKEEADIPPPTDKDVF